MRVAMIDPSLFTLPYDAALARGLRASGHQVTLYGRRPTTDDNDATDAGLVPVFYPVAGTRLAAKLPKRVRLAVKGADHVASMARLAVRLSREAPDLIHFQWLPLPIIDRRFLGSLRRIAPLVLTVHDTNPFNGNPAAGLQTLGAHAAFERFDRLIVHTEQGRARLSAGGVEANRLIVMPHGLLEAVPPQGDADPMQGPITFTLFGKIKPYKGVDVLIEAFARMPPVLRDQARLRVVGKPYMDLAPLHALAAARGVAGALSIEPRFVADSEVPDLFGGGVVATFPYREIEASGVLGLAIAHGRPILASRLGSFAESVEDRRHGSLVPPDDVGALSEAMAEFVSDRAFAASCAAEVTSLASRIPSWEEIGAATARLYAEIRRERAGRSIQVAAPLATG